MSELFFALVLTVILAILVIGPILWTRAFKRRIPVHPSTLRWPFLLAVYVAGVVLTTGILVLFGSDPVLAGLTSAILISIPLWSMWSYARRRAP